MRKLLLLLALIVLVIPVMAQDEEPTEEAPVVPVNYDCSTIGINRQADAWYNDYFAARGEFETEQAIEAAQVFSDNLASLASVCQAVVEAGPEEKVEQSGLGTIDSPYITLAAAVVGDTTIEFRQSIRPANDVLTEAGINGIDATPEDQEYLIVYLTISCQAGSTSGCQMTPGSFRAIGDMGLLYLPALSEFDDYLPAPGTLLGGSERSGAIPFLISGDDTSLRLVYYPNGDAVENNALAYYFDVQGSANSFEVRPTTSELIIRNAPINGSTMGVLRGGQSAQADGRNADGSWIHVVAPEATGWVSADFIESNSDLMALSTLEE